MKVRYGDRISQQKTILFIDINPVIVLLQGPSGGQETKDFPIYWRISFISHLLLAVGIA